MPCLGVAQGAAPGTLVPASHHKQRPFHPAAADHGLRWVSGLGCRHDRREHVEAVGLPAELARGRRLRPLGAKGHWGRSLARFTCAQALTKLHDKSEARRKEGCRAIQARVRELMHARDDARIRLLLDTMARTLVGAPGLFERTGGLFGLSAAGTALGTQVTPYLDTIVNAAVTALDDDRPPVRFAGCEALFNVTKVARADMLRPDLFRAVFVAMLSVVGDTTDSDVRGGAWLLSTTLLDVASAQGDALDLPLFLDLFRAHSQAANPHIRQALLTWLRQLDSVPGIDVGDFLPQFLGPLLLMLQDPNSPVRSETHKVLQHFMGQLQTLSSDELADRVDLPAVVAILTETSVA